MVRFGSALLIAALLAASACGSDGSGKSGGAAAGGSGGDGQIGAGGSGGDDLPAGGCIPDATAIVLAPGDSTLSVSTSPNPVPFTARAVLADGGSRDVTARLGWSVHRDDDTPPGRFDGRGNYLPEPGAGGTVLIEATDGCLKGTTRLTLELQATFGDPPPATDDRFAGPVAAGPTEKLPVWIYPSDQTRFPRNIYRNLFQWRRGGNDRFRITFAGPGSTVQLYTDGKHTLCESDATAACFEADTTIWQAIAGSNAGATVRVTIDAITEGDESVYRSQPITIGFSKKDVKGAIFYWSTTAAGIRRASVSDADPENYAVGKPTPTMLENGAGAVECVACHTVSRSGKKMYGYTKAAKTGGFVYDVTLDPPPTPVITTQITTGKGFGTFRPDDRRVVATVGNFLEEFDADTGERFSRLPVAAGTNPDWSPSGNLLAYSDRGGDSPSSANLGVIDYADGAWGASRVLVPAAGASNLFPSFSPDGKWIAYARGSGGHGKLDYQLWVVKADGSGAPIQLATANQVVNGVVTEGKHENNMPTWAPSGDLDWIAFNSVRPYGVVLPKGGTQQIWVAAIDREKLARGEDASFPAFRFAFQGLTENNHRAFWTLDVRDPPTPGPSCSQLGESCEQDGDCCVGTTCVHTEFEGTCQYPQECIPDGGTCDGAGSGNPCCAGTYCQEQEGGTFQCLGVQLG